jgi:peptidoglycan/xylan/chitin deacetylase (PgdA/CDA1 family)
MNIHELKTIAKSVVGGLANRLNAFQFTCKGKVAILAYHRVVTPDDLNRMYIEPGMYVFREAFETQVRWLLERFEVLSFSQLLARFKDNEWDDRKGYVVLTFDDGWLDNYRNAFPILRKYQVPATIFLPTDYVGSNMWFWPERLAFILNSLSRQQVTPAQRESVRIMIASLPGMERAIATGQGGHTIFSIGVIIEAFKLLPPSEIECLIRKLSELLEVCIPDERLTVNWTEVTEMAMNGISFGAHSCAHHLLTRLDERTLQSEVRDCGHVLEGLQAGYVPVFCYPNGDNNPTIQRLVEKSSYAAAVGTRPGIEGRIPQNPYELRRIGMHQDVTKTTPLLSLHLLRSGWGW